VNLYNMYIFLSYINIITDKHLPNLP